MSRSDVASGPAAAPSEGAAGEASTGVALGAERAQDRADGVGEARPPAVGLRHLALWVADGAFEASVRFYIEGLGMRVDWQPDPNNVYLTSRGDNLALHRRVDTSASSEDARLDHLGFFVSDAATVHAWHAFLRGRADRWGIVMLSEVRTHRDASTSFYLRDPSGAQVQILHVPSCVDG